MYKNSERIFSTTKDHHHNKSLKFSYLTEKYLEHLGSIMVYGTIAAFSWTGGNSIRGKRINRTHWSELNERNDFLQKIGENLFCWFSRNLCLPVERPIQRPIKIQLLVAASFKSSAIIHLSQATVCRKGDHFMVHHDKSFKAN